MPTHNREDDYFIPVLAPYVQWVKAYRQLISELYREHKSVRRAWKAFQDAIPGIERRLEFGIFEQILLFSLFLSEWNNSEESLGHAEGRRWAKGDDFSQVGKDLGNQLDTVIQKLQDAFEQRDRALWNLKHVEQNVLMLRDQKADLEARISGLKNNSEMLQAELDTTNEQLRRVRQELDSYRSQNASLKEENAGLRNKENISEQQIEKLRKKLSRLSLGSAQSRQIEAVKKPDDKEAFAQAVIQWVRQEASERVIQSTQQKASPRRIGRWNAQHSKDGYYRLYRKVRGRVHSIYIGKELDIGKAERRIAAKEKELFSSSPSMGGENAQGNRQMKMEVSARVIDSARDGPAN